MFILPPSLKKEILNRCQIAFPAGMEGKKPPSKCWNYKVVRWGGGERVLIHADVSLPSCFHRLADHSTNWIELVSRTAKSYLAVGGCNPSFLLFADEILQHSMGRRYTAPTYFQLSLAVRRIASAGRLSMTRTTITLVSGKRSAPLFP